jgi:hypothetical protein
VQWQWGAAAYTCLPAPPAVYNILNLKPTHQNACNVNNGDQCGDSGKFYVPAVCDRRSHGRWRFELYGIMEQYGVSIALRTVISP